MKQLYLCRHCRTWRMELTEQEAAHGCPDCGAPLEQVPVDEEAYAAWDDETREAFHQEYLKATQAEPPQPTPQPAPEKKAKSGCVGSFARLTLGLVVIIAVFYAVTFVSNWLHANNNSQRQAQISLNTILEDGGVIPVGEYVSLDARWVIGPYATESAYRELHLFGSDSGLTATTSETDYYYVILEDDTILSVATANAAEKETLNRMTDWLLGVDGFPMDGETILLQGTLETLKDEELLAFFKENLTNIFGIPASSPMVRTLVLNTAAGREGGNIGFTVAVTAVVAVIVLLAMKRKKKQAVVNDNSL